MTTKIVNFYEEVLDRHVRTINELEERIAALESEVCEAAGLLSEAIRFKETGLVC